MFWIIIPISNPSINYIIKPDMYRNTKKMDRTIRQYYKSLKFMRTNNTPSHYFERSLEDFPLTSRK